MVGGGGLDRERCLIRNLIFSEPFLISDTWTYEHPSIWGSLFVRGEREREGEGGGGGGWVWGGGRVSEEIVIGNDNHMICTSNV